MRRARVKMVVDPASGADPVHPRAPDPPSSPDPPPKTARKYGETT
jgi:hypothetical protein